MDISKENETTVERISELELVVTHIVNAPARLVWQAWTNPELFRQWWVPKSFPITLQSCEMDVRIGGQYKLVFPFENSTMEFFGTYVEVEPTSRLVWTNDEGEAGQTITTVTFEEVDGKTKLSVLSLFPSKEALEADGSTAALPEVLGQLEEIVASLG